MQPNSALIEAEVLKSHSEIRDELTSTLRLELVGPDNQIDSQDLINESLSLERPLQRYKLGILYPKARDTNESQDIEKDASIVDLPKPDSEDNEKIFTKACEASLEVIQNREIPDDAETLYENEAISDLALSGLNRPASMAISFFIPESSFDQNIIFTFSGGVYQNPDPYIWVRRPTYLKAEYAIKDIIDKNSFELVTVGEMPILQIKLKIFVRKYAGQGLLITYTAINETPQTVQGIKIKTDARCSFQSQLKVSIAKLGSSSKPTGISTYPGKLHDQKDPELASLNLLYRQFATFGVGHGCSADWNKGLNTEFVDSVWSSSLPEYETFSITPDLEDDKGNPIKVSMYDLGGIDNEVRGLQAIDDLIHRYELWINKKIQEAKDLPKHFHESAFQNIEKCKNALLRIKAGKEFIENDTIAQKAFRLANKAILIQQKRFSDTRREIQTDERNSRISFDKQFISTEDHLADRSSKKGYWRPFQIAFLLLSLKSASQGDAPDRDHVDLIWFPTGGGKTEAYFGLAAFTILYRRLLDSSDIGVSALMRYTLRLLTADQFERAAGLMCALEYIRRENSSEMGTEPFSIGIWLGGSTTPNKRDDAIKSYRELKLSSKNNKFLVTKCPWCSAQIGPIRSGRKTEVHGYIQEGGYIKIHCPDVLCDFNHKLPVYVVDEDIYEFRPTLVIGTVDKFAQIAWDPRCRSIFGINQDGEREFSPPGLIIQDELHLISGPLGSMVGLYETLIEELCTDNRNKAPVKPKIICSTATIRRFETQIKSLYGRSEALLFPSPGIEAQDSFFSKWQSHEKQRGRKYIGIYAPGESIQTMQVRTMAAALQAGQNPQDNLKDPWWTLLIFFNSLRELGNTISLFQSDIRTRLNILRRRLGLDKKDVRWLNNIEELTSRLKNDEIDSVRNKLKQSYIPGEKNYNVIDVCLASNIIEVGVDISRLGLMAIVGQPKTTAQYIQVSGRVGRTPEKPGLILTIYSASKPRDRSHFEKFRSYHEKLYAQVEPTSVTPFSRPALERALHAVIVGYLRQTMPLKQLKQPWPIPDAQIKEIIEKVKERIIFIYPAQKDQNYILENIDKAAEEFLDKWRSYKINKWEAKSEEEGLLYRAGMHVTNPVKKRATKTPQSMRNVDMECKGTIAYSFKTKQNTDDNGY